MPPTKQPRNSSTYSRPDFAVFAAGDEQGRPLAILPEAINASYPTRPLERIRAEVVDGVAVYPIEGPLEHKGCSYWWSFWQTYEQIARDFKALLDDSTVTAVVLKMDSPGGDVSGLNETVRIMQGFKEAAGKPVIAYVDEACYSAAYALAMVADEVYLPESGGVGSIGVITSMQDVTAAAEKAGVRVEVIASGAKKTDGHPYVPLSEGAIKRTRATVNKLAGFFFELVSEGRGLSTKKIAGFEAGIFTGEEAVAAGLADGVMSLSDCLTTARNAFSSPKEPADRSAGKEPEDMPPVLAAQKALNDANKLMAAAKTDADRALAAAKVVAAEQTLEAAKLAKVKKTKTVTTDTHEEMVDDGEEEEPEDDGEDAEGEGDEESAEDDGEDTSASARRSSVRAASGSVSSRIVAFARKLTGKKSDEEVMGALQAMADAHKGHVKLAGEVAELKANALKRERDELISGGLKAGKLTPGQKAWAKTLAPKALKAYLDAAPSMVHTIEDEHTESRVEGSKLGTVSAEMARIWKKQGYTEQDFPKLLEKFNGVRSGANGVS